MQSTKTSDPLGFVQTLQIGGLKFAARPGTSDKTAITEVVKKKSYERKDFKIQPGERWLDLGANVGAFSCYALKQGAEVVGAVEPIKENARLAAYNLHLNGWGLVPVLELAVVDDHNQQDQISMGIANTRYAQWRHSIYKQNAKRRVQVPTVQFSQLLNGVDAVKMDIEGAEIAILSLVEDWRDVRKLTFEWHFDVCPTISVFREVLDRLAGTFPNVRTGPLPDAELWTWFPPARLVHCWR